MVHFLILLPCSGWWGSKACKNHISVAFPSITSLDTVVLPWPSWESKGPTSTFVVIRSVNVLIWPADRVTSMPYVPVCLPALHNGVEQHGGVSGGGIVGPVYWSWLGRYEWNHGHNTVYHWHCHTATVSCRLSVCSLVPDVVIIRCVSKSIFLLFY